MLGNGKVLVAGGAGNFNYLESAELYDPSTGTWTGTGSLSDARLYCPAMLLGNGKVLAAAGFSRDGSVLETADLYDPATGNWTTAGTVKAKRGWHSATLLGNGKVLLAGGSAGSDSLASAELYDPLASPATPTSSPSASGAAPTIIIKGKKKVQTPNAKQVIKGTVTGVTTSVTFRVGKKGKSKPAKLTGTSWKCKAKLIPGKNLVTVIAHGPGGDSAPAKVKVIRD